MKMGARWIVVLALALPMMSVGQPVDTPDHRAPTVSQEPTLEQLIRNRKGPIRARKDRGVVHAIDLDQRTGEISGYSYHFGPPAYDLKVTLLGSSYGALELLEPGMKVEVVYGDFGSSRLAFSIEQLPASEVVEH